MLLPRNHQAAFGKVDPTAPPTAEGASANWRLDDDDGAASMKMDSANRTQLMARLGGVAASGVVPGSGVGAQAALAAANANTAAAATSAAMNMGIGVNAAGLPGMKVGGCSGGRRVVAGVLRASYLRIRMNRP